VGKKRILGKKKPKGKKVLRELSTRKKQKEGPCLILNSHGNGKKKKGGNFNPFKKRTARSQEAEQK